MLVEFIKFILSFFRREENILSEYEENSLKQYSKLKKEARHNIGKT